VSSAAADYYANIDPNAEDNVLKQQLKDLINPHTVLTYDDVWIAFKDVDIYLPRYPCNQNNPTFIPDVYSTYCWNPDVTTQGGKCGNYKQEGDCFNREHLWPKSWFGGFDYGANCQTDLFELWPSDGYVNGLRGNYPFGNVDPKTVTYKSTSGCLIGKCNNTGYTGSCFEPEDQMKGDFARSYFYISTAYWKEWTCCDTEGTSKSDIKPWMETILRQWHYFDPVDELERNRNEVIYSKWQHNRNPFIDHPEWVDQISDF
jgi:endonuclease I